PARSSTHGGRQSRCSALSRAQAPRWRVPVISPNGEALSWMADRLRPRHSVPLHKPSPRVPCSVAFRRRRRQRPPAGFLFDPENSAAWVRGLRRLEERVLPLAGEYLPHVGLTLV